MAENIWSWFLEDYPEIGYQAYIPQRGAPSFLDYWRRQMGGVTAEYNQALGQMARRGQAPSLMWTDFLANYPWLQRYLGLAPEERGERASLFSPRLRWNI